MPVAYDLLIKEGHVIDPRHALDGVMDIAVSDGRVALVGPNLKVTAHRVLRLNDSWVFPGLIDLHVHASSDFNGHVAHKMLARAGITTALELGGPIADVLQHAARHGAGLTLACLDRIIPGERIPDADPAPGEIKTAIHQSLRDGAIGVKILGGHFPLSPEATAGVIKQANEMAVYIAFHCGTLRTGSDLTGLREALELAGKNRLHVAHVNSYCRGRVHDPVDEAREAIRLLSQSPQVFSESYLAAINGTFGRCVDGVPVSQQTRLYLRLGGYPETYDGLRRAIIDGYAKVNLQVGDDTILITGQDAAQAWEAAGTLTGVSFDANPPLSRLLLALARDGKGRFAVDALATDGGGIPRNNLVSAGLALVNAGMMTVADLVRKTSEIPARVLGLPRKGHLAEGADADITIVERSTNRVVTTIAHGEIIMHEGIVIGSGSRVLTTAAGIESVASAGCRPEILDLGRSGFYTGDGLKA